MPRVTRQLDTSFLKRRRAPVRRPRRGHVLRFEPLEDRYLLTAAGDFNGDGYQDLIVGIPGEDYEGGAAVVQDAGAVQVIYGSPGGLAATSDKPATILFQDSTPDPDGLEPFDRFGFSAAVGDFDSDGYDDVAIGVPYEDVNGMADAGAVEVFYGSSIGLNSFSGVWLHQNRSTIPGNAALGNRFGHALATGYFNDDEWADLAIGAPGEGKFVGSVTIVYGHSTGLYFTGILAPPPLKIVQGDLDSADGNDKGDNFGFSLATGRLNNDDFDDLVIGAPFETYIDELPDGETDYEAVEQVEAGAVHVVFGAEGGLSFDGNQTWFQGAEDQNGLPVALEPQSGDGFGFSLAIGNFDNDGLDDLAIGIPFRDDDPTGPDKNAENASGYDNNKDAGLVVILYTDDSTLSASGDEWFFYPVFERSDMAGFSMAAGNFNADDYDDLAIGVPNADFAPPSGYVQGSGAVYVRYGSDEGLDVLNNGQFLTQDAQSLTSTSDDLFGHSLTAGRFGSDDPKSPMDLIVGVPNALVDGIEGAGAIDVFLGDEKLKYGSRWHQSTNANVSDAPETRDGFGAALGPGSTVIAPVAAAAPLPASPPIVTDGVAPLTAQQMQNMEAYIRSQLDLNIVAYQAAIGQPTPDGSGELSHTFAYGRATPDTDSNGIPDLTYGELMTVDKKHNLGSVSKMVIALTVLKLADLGELDLTAPYISYLNPARFDPDDIHPTVKEVTVLELLTMTSQLEMQNCCLGDVAELGAPSYEVADLGGPSYVESQPRRTYNCFDSAISDAAALPSFRCLRDYQNQSTGKLRYVVQGIRGTGFRAIANAAAEGIDVSSLTKDEFRELERMEFEQEVRDIWLDAAGLDDVHCQPLLENEDVKYFHVNGQGEFVVDQPDDSPSCSAGGWRFSARDVLKMLRLIRTGRMENGLEFLPNSEDDFLHRLLLDTTLADATGSPGSTALTWEEPWESPLAPEVKILGKNGALNGVRTYATLLPGGGYATLLSNTHDNGEWRDQDEEGITGQIDPTVPNTNWIRVLKTAYLHKDENMQIMGTDEADTFTLEVDPAFPNYIKLTQSSVGDAYYIYPALLTSITFNGGLGDDRLIVNSLPPDLAIPITFFGGDGDDRLALNFNIPKGSLEDDVPTYQPLPENNPTNAPWDAIRFFGEGDTDTIKAVVVTDIRLLPTSLVVDDPCTSLSFLSPEPGCVDSAAVGLDGVEKADLSVAEQPDSALSFYGVLEIDAEEFHGDTAFRGGHGTDLIRAGAGTNTYNGGRGNDQLRIFGTDDADSIIVELEEEPEGMPGVPDFRLLQVTGYGGNDTIDVEIAGTGVVVTVNGNDGSDTIDLTKSDSGGTLAGGRGNDTINGSDAADTIQGSLDNDDLDGGGGDDMISGGTGDDTMLGGEGRDEIFGEEGHDVINGQEGNDTIYGGSENDSIRGESGFDELFGNEGYDTIYGGVGNDLLVGGGQSDLLHGDRHPDDVGGGICGSSPNVLCSDVLYGDEVMQSDVYYEGGNDVLDGDEDDDQVFGGPGDDVYQFHAPGLLEEEDTVVEYFGHDTDWLEFRQIASAVTVNLTSQTLATHDDRMVVTISDAFAQYIENVRGTDYGDDITGNDADNRIIAYEGNNTVRGGLGDDTIEAESGDDVIYGEQDADMILAGDGQNSVYGGLGEDHIQTGRQDDLILGEHGNDLIRSADGNDSVFGDDGEDTIEGGDGFDFLVGGWGSDIILGEDHDDTIIGGRLEEGYDGGPFDAGDAIDGGEGNDLIMGDDGSFDFAPPYAPSLIGGDDTIVGGIGDDTIFGQGGSDLIDGGPDTDSMDGGGGNDTFHFGGFTEGEHDVVAEAADEGSDTLDFGLSPLPVIVDMTGDDILAPSPQGRLLSVDQPGQSAHIENIIGTAFSDSFRVAPTSQARHVDGANPTLPATPGDVLIVDAQGADLTISGTGIAGVGIWPITFEDIESPLMILNAASILVNAGPGQFDGTADFFTVARDSENTFVTVNGSVVFETPADSAPPLTVMGSGDDDTLTVSFGGGPNGNPIPAGLTYNGRNHVTGDTLILDGPGQGQNSGVYEPDPASFGNGTVNVQGSTITFMNLEPVIVYDWASFTFLTPGNQDNLMIDSPAANQNNIAGTSDGVPFEQLIFYAVESITIDVTTNETGRAVVDSITFAADLAANGLQSLNLIVSEDDLVDASAVTSLVPLQQGDGWTFVIPMPGDVTLDGVVDLEDMVWVQGNLGTRAGAGWQDGDLDGDGDVDRSDAALLAGAYGKAVASAPSAPSASAPASLIRRREGVEREGVLSGVFVARPARVDAFRRAVRGRVTTDAVKLDGKIVDTVLEAEIEPYASEMRVSREGIRRTSRLFRTR